MATPKGALGTSGRNTERLNPTNNFDVTFAKSVNFKENVKFRFDARFFNIFNHAQYVGGYLSDVAPIGFTDTATHNFTIPGAVGVPPAVAGVLQQSAQHHARGEDHLLRSAGSV